MPLVSISEILSLYLVSVAAQAGLWLPIVFISIQDLSLITKQAVSF